MNNIADVLLRKQFFNTPRVTKAEHFVDLVVSNSVPKTLKFHKSREATQNDVIFT